MMSVIFLLTTGCRCVVPAELGVVTEKLLHLDHVATANYMLFSEHPGFTFRWIGGCYVE